MKICRVATLRGPSPWSCDPLFDVSADLSDLANRDVCDIHGLRERLLDHLPNPRPHDPAYTSINDATARIRNEVVQGVMLPQLLSQVVLGLAGGASEFAKTHACEEPGRYRILLGFEEEAIDRLCIEAAFRMLSSLLEGDHLDPEAEIAALRTRANEVRLGPSTHAIVRAAHRRGIPTRRLSSGSLVQLGWGNRQRRIWTAQTDRAGAIAAEIASDKELTRCLLRSAGLPVPDGRVVQSQTEAWQAACDLGLPVAVKPRDSNHGQGVAIGLTTREQVEAAFAIAAGVRPGIDTEVLVERSIGGDEYRLLVVGGRVVAAYRGEPPTLIGDGIHSIRELATIANSDPRRGKEWRFELDTLEFDGLSRLVLESQGYLTDSIPGLGKPVILQRWTDRCIDVTDDVHPAVAQCVIEAAEIIGLDIAGVDVRTGRIDRPLDDQGGCIIEVNAGPGLMGHLHPAEGSPRPVGEAIVNHLFADHHDGRIPLIAVTGAQFACSTARRIAQQLSSLGRFVGLACTDGVFLDSRRLAGPGIPSFDSVHALLQHPRLEAAVVQVEPVTLSAEGLPFDRAPVVVLTDLGDPPQRLVAQTARLLLDRMPPEGLAVLSPEDERVIGEADTSSPRITRLYSVQPTDKMGSTDSQAQLVARAVAIAEASLRGQPLDSACSATQVEDLWNARTMPRQETPQVMAS